MNMGGFGLIADDCKRATWEVLDSLVNSQWPLPFGLLTHRSFCFWSGQVATCAAENLLLISTAV